MQEAKALRDEYTRTIAPARAIAAETLKLERVLNAECGMRSAEWSWLASALTPAESVEFVICLFVICSGGSVKR